MKIAVPVKTFSSNEILVNELLTLFPNSKVNARNMKLESSDLIEFIKGYDGIIVGLESIDETLLQQSPDLKAIVKYGVGLDNIDFDACKRYKIPVLYEKGVNKTSVAELTLGFMLSLSRNIYSTCEQLKNNIWNKAGGQDLSSKTVGIIGVGNIGKEVIRLLKPFNCRILVNDVVQQDDYYKSYGLVEVSKKTLLEQSDIVTVHTPLNQQMHHFFNKSTFQQMKTDSILINAARGAIVNSQDLKWALKNNIIKGAALDVYEQEPPTDYSLISLPNLICTPHIGGNSIEAILMMGRSSINMLQTFSQQLIKVGC
ncbi:MAG: phosphoglycerate dehydrogenase [Bacteroidales bacterium]|nr:phosphoglycerate dehydrogenase [Bacteroidales bacterium]